MARYRVYVKEVSYGFVNVEVDSEDEIIEKAQDEYFAGNVDWTDGDFDIKDWEEAEAD